MAEDHPGTWLCLTVRAPGPVREALAALLVEWGAGGTVEEADATVVYFTPGQREHIEARLRRYGADLGIPISWTWKEVAETGWRDRWKAFFRPTRVSERLAVCPTWEDWTPENPAVRVIRVDPGQAFGTGTHETTRLCLGVLDTLLASGTRGPVLDVGCGSGILSIGALLLGASAAKALDIDSVAARTTRANALQNSVEDRLTVWCGDIRSVRGRYPLVVANIIHQVLLGLAPELGRRTAPGGVLVLSGMLVEELDSASRAYGARGFNETARLVEGEWGALVLGAEPLGG